MNPLALIALDLERINRLKLGEVTIIDQSEEQIKYQVKLAGDQDRSAVVSATGKLQNLFGPRLLSSGSHIGPEGNVVEARVCLIESQLSMGAPESVEVSVTSFLARAKGKA